MFRFFPHRDEVRLRPRQRDISIPLRRERTVGVDDGGVDRPLRQMVHRVDGNDKRHRSLARDDPVDLKIVKCLDGPA